YESEPSSSPPQYSTPFHRRRTLRVTTASEVGPGRLTVMFPDVHTRSLVYTPLSATVSRNDQSPVIRKSLFESTTLSDVRRTRARIVSFVDVRDTRWMSMLKKEFPLLRELLLPMRASVRRVVDEVQVPVLAHERHLRHDVD